MTVALVTFTVAAFCSPPIEQFGSLMIAFYFGIILIPGYAAVLLKQYQDVLKRLSEINAARARFIANMSQELRTPLHAIIGNAEVIRARLEELERSDSTLKPLSISARMVSDASEHLRALVDGVLDIASNDAGTFVLGEPGDVDLYRLIQSAVGISRADTRKKNIVLTSFVDGGVPRIVQTWDQHLKAVLINTIGNAVKYTDTGSVFVAVRPLSYSDDGYVLIVRVEITDTGIGIPAEQLRTLCEPFASGDDSRNRRF
jgi:signal transduction histidine kinase